MESMRFLGSTPNPARRGAPDPPSPNPEGRDQAAELYPSPEAWVQAGDGVHLIGSRCGGCGKITFPARSLCDECDNTSDFQPVRLGNTGTLYSFSEVFVAPAAFKTPYVIGYVDLPEGVRLCGQVEHPAAELRVDEPVQMVLGVIRKDAEGRPVVSFKFRKLGVASDA